MEREDTVDDESEFMDEKKIGGGQKGDDADSNLEMTRVERNERNESFGRRNSNLNQTEIFQCCELRKRNSLSLLSSFSTRFISLPVVVLPACIFYLSFICY